MISFPRVSPQLSFVKVTLVPFHRQFQQTYCPFNLKGWYTPLVMLEKTASMDMPVLTFSESRCTFNNQFCESLSSIKSLKP